MPVDCVPSSAASEERQASVDALNEQIAAQARAITTLAIQLADAWRAARQAHPHASLISFGRRKRKHNVYLAREHGTRRVKIGWSNEPERRIKELRRTGEGAHVASLVAVIPDAAKPLELALHELFSPWRHDGEWFRDCKPLNEWIGGLPRAS